MEKQDKFAGKDVLYDRTESGVGDLLVKTYWDKPKPKDKEAVATWKAKVIELVDKYNALVGFEAWGKEFPPPYDNE